MKPSSLKPGQRVLAEIGSGAPVEMVFVRRLRPGLEIAPNNGGVCVFECAAFRGLNGPEDSGRCTMTDARVSRAVHPA